MYVETCPGCGEAILKNAKECRVCAEIEAREKLESRLDVIMLNGVETLDELKEWIKEYLLSES